MHTSILFGVIEAGGVFILRIFASFAAIGFAGIGVLIFRKRDELFDRDPEVLNDTPGVRHVRVEAVAVVWLGVMLALLGVVYQVWRA